MTSEDKNSRLCKQIKHLGSYSRDGNIVVFDCRLDTDEEASVKIDVPAPNMVRVRASLEKTFELSLPEKDGFLKADWTPQKFTVKEVGGTVEIEAERMKVKIDKEPFKLSFYDENGNLLLKEHDECGIMWEDDAVYETISSPCDELFYGFADQGRGWPIPSARDKAPLNHRGTVIAIDGGLTNNWGFGLPFFLSSRGYGLYLNTTSASTFDMAVGNQDRYTFNVDIPELDYYIIYGPSFKEILARYTELTGKSPLIPKWSMAPRVSGALPGEEWIPKGLGGLERFRRLTFNPGDGRGLKAWYFQKQIEDQAQTIRAEHKPCGILYLDAWAHTGMTSFIWNSEIPEPEKMIETLIKNNIRFCLWQRPWLVAHARSDGSYAGQRLCAGETYEEAYRMGYFVKGPDGKPFLHDNAAFGPSSLVDFTNPEAVKWWKEKQSSSIEMGTRLFWLDSTSSGSVNLYPEGHNLRFHNGMTGRRLKCYNNPLYYKMVFEGLKEELKGKRALLDCRCVTPIAPQRFPLQSYGDRTGHTTAATHVRCAINYGLTGIPFWYSGVFGLFGPPLPAEIQMRFNPYTYTYWREANQTGIPIVRGMVLEYQDDPNTKLIDDQYMFGREFLIAPMLEEGQTDRPVYFPKGEWINIWSGERFRGPRTVTCLSREPDLDFDLKHVDAGTIKVLIFVKAGSIIPLAPPMEWADQKPWDPLTLEVYLSGGGGKAEFTLYEDDGDTYAYEEGEYAETRFEAEEDDDRVVIRIGASEGNYEGKLEKRTYVAKLEYATCPTTVERNGERLPQHKSQEELEAEPSGWFYDGRRRTVWCKTGPLGISRQAVLTLKHTKTMAIYEKLLHSLNQKKIEGTGPD